MAVQAQAVTCRKCTVAGYLEEEARDHGKDDAESILALAASWRRKCRCHDSRTLLRSLRVFPRGKHRSLHVHRVHREMEQGDVWENRTLVTRNPVMKST
jgi:hypothetical protein